LVVLFIGAVGAWGGSGGCAGECDSDNACTLPPICGEPERPCSCGCIDGEVIELADGPHVCMGNCLKASGGFGGNGSGGSGGNGSGGSGGNGSGGGGGGGCANAEVGRLCVRGTVDSQTNQEVLTAGGPVMFQVMPKGCYSSSCTIVKEASCVAPAPSGGAFELTAAFCLEGTMDQGCTPDCSGGGFASCEQASVPAGQYTATLANLMVTFDVPSVLPAGGMCVGQVF
jgi:hypothetical protein